MTKRVIIFGVVTLILSNCTTKTFRTSQKDIEIFNRNFKYIRKADKYVLRLNEKEGSGIAWLNNTEFTLGTIEFDAKGRDKFQKSF